MKLLSPRKLHYPFFLLILLLGLSSCSDKYREVSFEPIVVDTGDILSKQTKEAFLEYDYPKGVAVVVVAENAVDTARVGLRANEVFKDLTKTHRDPKGFKKRGILIYITKDPALVQVRTGNKFNYVLNYSGVTAGEDYLYLQESIEMLGLGECSFLMLKNTLAGVASIEGLGRWQRYRLNSAINSFASLMQNYSFPTDSFWSDAFLEPTLKVTAFLKTKLGSWIWSFLLLGLVLYIIRTLILFLFKLLLSRFRIIMQLVRIATTIVFSFLYSISAAMAAVLLAGSRLEDRFALKAMDSAFLENFTFDSVNYSTTAGFWLIFLFLFVLMLNKLISHPLVWIYTGQDSYIQKARMEKLEKDNYVYAIIVTGMAGGNEEDPFGKAMDDIGQQSGGQLGLLSIAVLIVPQIYLTAFLLLMIPRFIRNVAYFFLVDLAEHRNSPYKLKKFKGDGFGLIVVFAILIVIFTFAIKWTNPMKDVNKRMEEAPYHSTYAASYPFVSDLWKTPYERVFRNELLRSPSKEGTWQDPGFFYQFWESSFISRVSDAGQKNARYRPYMNRLKTKFEEYIKAEYRLLDELYPPRFKERAEVVLTDVPWFYLDAAKMNCHEVEQMLLLTPEVSDAYAAIYSGRDLQEIKKEISLSSKHIQTKIPSIYHSFSEAQKKWEALATEKASFLYYLYSTVFRDRNARTIQNQFTAYLYEQRLGQIENYLVEYNKY